MCPAAVPEEVAGGLDVVGSDGLEVSGGRGNDGEGRVRGMRRSRVLVSRGGNGKEAEQPVSVVGLGQVSLRILGGELLQHSQHFPDRVRCAILIAPINGCQEVTEQVGLQTASKRAADGILNIRKSERLDWYGGLGHGNHHPRRT